MSPSYYKPTNSAPMSIWDIEATLHCIADICSAWKMLTVDIWWLFNVKAASACKVLRDYAVSSQICLKIFQANINTSQHIEKHQVRLQLQVGVALIRHVIIDDDVDLKLRLLLLGTAEWWAISLCPPLDPWYPILMNCLNGGTKQCVSRNHAKPLVPTYPTRYPKTFAQGL